MGLDDGLRGCDAIAQVFAGEAGAGFIVLLVDDHGLLLADDQSTDWLDSCVDRDGAFGVSEFIGRDGWRVVANEEDDVV